MAVSGVGGSTGACVEGLRRLQYRGYDSYGFAWARQGCIDRLRSLEALDDLVEILPEAPAALGHTRWATHGGVTLANCHPHLAEGDRFALAHNGIVENYQALQHEAEGVPADESDTRVIVRLLAAELSRGTDRGTAVRAVCGRLRGRNTVVVLFDDGELFGYRHGSPLVLGDGGEMVFLASDALSFAPRTRRCFLVPDKALVRIRGTGIAVSGEGNNAIALRWEDAGFEDDDFGKDGHPHFMIKEVMEQWRTIPQQATLTRDALDGLCSA
ncbi:MAG: class II glutamine amidotransferase, partial [Pseudomonadales bacterium]|nr:class II glutamine amidotransferase [Pseudomonadales bacterium]